MVEIERRSTITCPHCRHRQPLIMPLNTCRVHYQCPNCGAVLRGNGDIGCVFTAYGSVPCPFMQSEYAMFAWFDFLDRRLRQRAQLLAKDKG